MKKDLDTFCMYIKESLPEKAFFKSLGIPSVQPEEVNERICNVFKVENQ